MKCFDPDAEGGDGAFALPEDYTSDPFQSYLQLESPLLKYPCGLVLLQIRREHQVLEAAKPFIQILTENRCSTGYDLLYNVRGVGELVSWAIPKPLAVNIFDVIEQIHQQTARASKRNILREMYISPNFDKFLHERKSKAASVPDEEVVEQAQPANTSRPSSPAVDESLKDQIRDRLEKDVLMLPIQNAELSASDVLFKAAFLVCDQVATSSCATFAAFLDSLVAFQTKGDSLALRQLIRERVDLAKQIADKCASSLEAVGVKNAADLVVRASLVDSKLDPSIAAKVRELLAGVSTQVLEDEIARRSASSRSWVPKNTRATVLEPQNASRSTAQLSPLIRQGRAAISTLANDDIDKVKIPF